MTRNPTIGIVIPCYNEEENLVSLIKQCMDIQKNSDIRFLLVNNGSKDSTKDIFQSYENTDLRFLNLDVNLGYGGGILAGLKELSEDYVGWIHADMQTNLEESLRKIPKFNFDYYKGIRTGRGITENIFSYAMGFYCSLIFKKWLFEINAQPTLMSREIYNNWKKPPTDFSLDLYSLVIAKKFNAVISRDKNKFEKRKFGNSHWNTGFKSQLRMAIKTIKYCHQLSRSIVI